MSRRDSHTDGHYHLKIRLEFEDKLSDAGTFPTTSMRAAPSMVTATSPMTALTLSQPLVTGPVPRRSENICQDEMKQNVLFRFAKNTGLERTRPITTLHTLPE